MVGLLVQAMARRGVRVLPLLRSSHEALDLLQQGLVHLAGIHFAHDDGRSDNDRIVAATLGSGCRLVHQMEWQSGIATATDRRERSARALLSANVRWVNREEGSAARQAFDTLLGRRRRPQGYDRIVRGHRAVAATVSSGWAEAGVCIRPAAAESRLGFISLQRELYDLCLRDDLVDDPRIVALDATLRSREYRQFVANTPGCAAGRTGEHRPVRAEGRPGRPNS